MPLGSRSDVRVVAALETGQVVGNGTAHRGHACRDGQCGRFHRHALWLARPGRAYDQQRRGRPTLPGPPRALCRNRLGRSLPPDGRRAGVEAASRDFAFYPGCGGCRRTIAGTIHCLPSAASSISRSARRSDTQGRCANPNRGGRYPISIGSHWSFPSFAFSAAISACRGSTRCCLVHAEVPERLHRHFGLQG